MKESKIKPKKILQEKSLKPNMVLYGYEYT